MSDWMFAVSLMTDLLTWVALIVGGLLLRSYLPAYFQEKGKNLATKEDIEVITDKVERVRSQYVSDLERLRADLREESEILGRRRNLYERLVKALDIFVAGRPATQEQKNGFLADYSTLWLWAPDSVVRAVTELLDLNAILAEEPNRVDQRTLKQAYTKCILEMRKSSGFPETTLNHEEYRFAYF